MRSTVPLLLLASCAGAAPPPAEPHDSVVREEAASAPVETAPEPAPRGPPAPEVAHRPSVEESILEALPGLRRCVQERSARYAELTTDEELNAASAEGECESTARGVVLRLPHRFRSSPASRERAEDYKESLLSWYTELWRRVDPAAAEPIRLLVDPSGEGRRTPAAQLAHLLYSSCWRSVAATGSIARREGGAPSAADRGRLTRAICQRATQIRACSDRFGVDEDEVVTLTLEERNIRVEAGATPVGACLEEALSELMLTHGEGERRLRVTLPMPIGVRIR